MQVPILFRQLKDDEEMVCFLEKVILVIGDQRKFLSEIEHLKTEYMITSSDLLIDI
jgi:hypothetical protein